MHKENGLQFRAYVPTLMELLEDADGMIRDAAKSTVIELFRFAKRLFPILARFLTTITGMPRIQRSRI